MMSNTVKNSIGREVLTEIQGIGSLAPFAGAFARLDGSYSWTSKAPCRTVPAFGGKKLAQDLTEAIKRSGLQDGMTISFHHHLRNGDDVLPQVI
ncbi:MAG: citrate lyase subunit alpha, partial [Synergistales bacterium]|nr:citrate lyase subunit alpha [Synergistales bacterium]